MAAQLGRPPSTLPKFNHPLIVPLTAEQRAQIVEEARASNYRSVAAYVRDAKLFAAPIQSEEEAIAQR